MSWEAEGDGEVGESGEDKGIGEQKVEKADDGNHEGAKTRRGTKGGGKFECRSSKFE